MFFLTNNNLKSCGKVCCIDVKGKVLLKPHRVVLISISVALSQTPAYTARPWIWG